MPPEAGPDWVEAEVIEVSGPTGRITLFSGRTSSCSGNGTAPQAPDVHGIGRGHRPGVLP